MNIRRSIAPVVFTVVVSAVGVATVAGAQTPQAPPAQLASIGDLSTSQLIEVRDKAGQILLQGTFKTSEKDSKETERKAELTSPTGQNSKGKVAVEMVRKEGVVTENELEIEVEKLAGMIDCDVFVDGRHVASLLTSKKGKAEVKMKWKSTGTR